MMTAGPGLSRPHRTLELPAFAATPEREGPHWEVIQLPGGTVVLQDGIDAFLGQHELASSTQRVYRASLAGLAVPGGGHRPRPIRGGAGDVPLDGDPGGPPYPSLLAERRGGGGLLVLVGRQDPPRPAVTGRCRFPPTGPARRRGRTLATTPPATPAWPPPPAAGPSRSGARLRRSA